MTERFNAPSQQTTVGSSEIGPTESVSSLSAVGVGQGSGQSATKQENNSFIGFEYTIKWDDLSGNLAKLNTPKSLEQMVDDLTVRDRDLEDFLNTNIVNGIVAGSNITINRASGVVTITAANQLPQAWTAFTPALSVGGSYTLSGNGSRYVQIGKTVHVQLHCAYTTASAALPVGFQLPIAPVNTGLTYETAIGVFYTQNSTTASNGIVTGRLNGTTSTYTTLRYSNAYSTSTSFQFTASLTYEAA